MAEEKWVTWDGLKYYDTKIKGHIDSELEKLEEKIPSMPDLSDIESDVEEAKKIAQEALIKVNELQDHIDENEAAIESLRNFDLNVTAEIASLTTHMQYTVKKEDLNEYATEAFVADAIRAAELSKDVDLSDYYKKGDVDSLINEVKIETATANTKIAGLSNKLADIELDVDKNHELIESLLVSVENKADESHEHHLSDIIDYEAVDLTNYATKDDLKDAIDNLLIPDFDDYYTKSEIDRMIPEIDNLVTKQELEVLTDAVGAVEESLDEKVDKDQLVGLASESYVDKKVDSISVPTSVSELENDIGYITSADIPDVSELATKGELATVQQQSARNEVKILQIDSELVDITSQLENISTEYVTTAYIEQNYITTEQIEKTYVTTTELTETVESTVVDVVQEKVSSGEIDIAANKITYGDFEDDI